MPKEVTLFVGVNDNLKEIKSEIPDNEPKPWDGKDMLKHVGTKVPRIDGHLKTSGKAKYTADINLPGMLWAKYLRSPYPSAIVKNIDISKAEKYPGVKAVEIVGELPMKIRFAGDEILAVAAVNEQVADEALKLIKVEYDVLDFVVGLEEAKSPSAPLVHEETIKREVTEADIDEADEGIKQSGNIRGPNIGGVPEDITEKDIENILADCQNVIEATYMTQVQTHSAMETHGVVAEWIGKQMELSGVYGSKVDTQIDEDLFWDDGTANFWCFNPPLEYLGNISIPEGEFPDDGEKRPYLSLMLKTEPRVVGAKPRRVIISKVYDHHGRNLER